MLTELVESMQTKLLALPPEKWGVLKVGTDTDEIPIEIGLDPDQISKATKRVIFLMPIVRQYNLRDSQQRGRTVKQVISTLVVSSAMVIPFSTMKIGDVGEWDEIQNIMNLRERLESNIMTTDFKITEFNYGYSLADVEAEPPQEIELNQRNFLAVTDYTFEIVSCP